MTDATLPELITADLTRWGWGVPISSAGLAVESVRASNKQQERAELTIPIIQELFPTGKRSGVFAQAHRTEDGYVLQAIQTGTIPVLREVLTQYAKDHQTRSVGSAHLAGVFESFTTVLATELTRNGVQPTPARILALFAFRYARGMGQTVNAAYAALPDGVYEFIAADVTPGVLLLNFSKRLNPTYAGNGRLLVPPIPLSDAQQLGRVPAQMLEDVYVTKTDW